MVLALILQSKQETNMTDRKPNVPRVSRRAALASLAALAAAPLASLPFGTGFAAPTPDLSGKPIRLIVLSEKAMR